MNFVASLIQTFARVDPDCQKSFFGLPSWFKYLETRSSNGCAPQLSGINDIWLIGLAIVEILLRVGIIVAIFFVLYGGIQYIASRGNADRVTNAKNTVIDALIGIIITIAAIAVVRYIGGRFG